MKFLRTKLLMIRLLFCACSLFGAKLPEIRPADALETMHQILDAHVTHKSLSSAIVQRIIECYLEELDPSKTYFIHSDIQGWLSIPEPELEKIQRAIEKEDFSVFHSIHHQMEKAISRRTRLNQRIATLPCPEKVSSDEFKKLEWATSEHELLDRLVKIHALQKNVVEKLDPETREKALQRIDKRRLTREEELGSSSIREKEKLILTLTLKAFASSLDTHTAYFTPAEAAQFMIQLQQRLFGIGVQLRDDLNGFTIAKIIEGGPAARTSLKENDRIIAIDGEPVVGMDILDVVELIRGEEGSSVSLLVLRETNGVEEKLDIPIPRGEVVLKEARIDSHVIPYGDGVIAHIALHAFYQDPSYSSAGDVYEAVTNIRKEHKLKGVILDLRRNSGGVLPQAVAVTGLFITKGIVVSIKDNNGKIEHLRDVDGRTLWDGPLIVLTSKASASAAEIVAQTLQDYGRALIVGDTQTYGKGTFQTFTLDASHNSKVNPKGEYKVTRGRYYTVSGKSPQLEGVKPDITVPGIFSALEIGEHQSKYPLENDSIKENFQDDLSDIPSYQRDQLSWLYRFNLQTCLKIYTQCLPTLKKNSELRIQEDPFYQNFLKSVEDMEEIDSSTLELYAQADLQLKETIHIMKDLIVLLK